MIELKSSRASAVSVLANNGRSTIGEHMEIVKSVTPAPLLTMSKHNLDMLKSFTPIPPAWLIKASLEQRAEARQQVDAGVTAHTALNNAMAGVKALKEFAEPLLKQKIREVFDLDVDVDKTWIELTPPTQLFSTPNSEYFTLLEAALHNFEEEEARPNHFFPTRAFTYEPGRIGVRKRISMNAQRFIELCRELNIGRQYQAHIKEVLKWDDAVAQGLLRDVFVGYHKAALKAASQIALLKDDIELKHHSALMEIISGRKSVRVDGKLVWCRSLSFMGMALHRCIIFELAEPDDQSILDNLWPLFDVGSQKGLIVYLPDDPDHPVKYYPSLNAFQARLISQFSRKNPGASQSSVAPTDYQNFFSRFVKYKDRAKYFTSFTERAPQEYPYRTMTKLRQKQTPDFLLQLRVLDPSGDPWRQTFDIWTTFFQEYKVQLLLDARSQAVPTENADASGRQGFIAHLFDIGLTVLTLTSFLVPPVGLVMLGVTAIQLMNEVLEGVEDLSLGDKEAGWRHITGVLENLMTMGASIPVFELLATPAHAEFNAIELPNGQKRLWKPDLSSYRSEVSLEGIEPNVRGQYRIAGRHYVRLDKHVFEKRFDPSTGKWRIRHPINVAAYQPILAENPTGDWIHSVERPLSQPAVESSLAATTDKVTDQGTAGESIGESDVAPPHPLPVVAKGVSNVTHNRYTVEESLILGLNPSKGIYRSADGQRFYIRNVDETGWVAVYQVSDSFNLNTDIVDVNIVDPTNNRGTELRLWQVAPDQWQVLSLKGGAKNRSLVTARDLLDWSLFPTEVHETYTLRQFAKDRGLFLPTLKRYALADGALTAEGLEFVNNENTPRRSVTAEHLSTWESLSARERHEWTREGFANRYNLDAAEFMDYVNQDGTLEPDAKALLDGGAIFTSSNPLNPGPAFTRKQLPNGLWEPKIEAVEKRYTRDLPFDWGEFDFVPYSAEPTDINRALSAPEFGHVTIGTELFNQIVARYSANVSSQMVKIEGGSSFVYSMQRMRYTGALEGEFNAIKIVDIEAGEIPDQANAVLGYWAPQGGYVDVPVYPGWGEPDYVFTPGFGGCSLVVDQLDENILRVRHVEGGYEGAQYNDLPAHEHGWGLSAAMEFPDYGIRVDQNGNPDSILTGFAFMKYDRASRVWKIYYQSSQGAASIFKYSTEKPGWFGKPQTFTKAYANAKVLKTEAKPVVTVEKPASGYGNDAASPMPRRAALALL